MKSNARQQPAAPEPVASTGPAGEGLVAPQDDPVADSSVASITQFPRFAETDVSGTADPQLLQESSPVQRSEQRRKEPRRMKILFVVLLAVAVGIVAWLSRRDPAAPPAAAAPQNSGPLVLAAVDVAEVGPRVLTRLLPLSGSMSPVVQATVKSKVAGVVEQVTVREGQDVQKGEVIARIDTRNLQAEYDRELAAVDKARADLDLATLNRDKNRQLLEQHYISQNTYESTESAYAGSVASFKLAQAQARLARINLEDAVIRAPFAGTIATRQVQPGEKVSPDSSIVTLVDLRQMLLEAAVPAAEIPSVHVGQTAHFKVGGFGDREFEGQVQRISPVTVNGSRAITIYISVANADRALKGGMFAQGNLTLDSTQPVLAVAQRAVHEEAGLTYVYTLDGNKIGRTPVTLGPQFKGNAFVEVRSGLKAGQRVIVADISDAKAGTTAIVRSEGKRGHTPEAASSDELAARSSDELAANR